MEPANLQDEWTAVSGAPYLSLGIFIVVVGIVWAVLHFLYKHRLEGLKRDLESEQAESTRLRGRVTEYEVKAGRTPDEAHDKIGALEERVARLSGRRLTDGQKGLLSAAMSRSPGSVNLQYSIGTPDGLRFQRDFADVFQKAGWQVGGGVIVGGMESETGLLVSPTDSPQGHTLMAALDAAGFAYDLWPRSTDSMGNADIGLLICPRSD